MIYLDNAATTAIDPSVYEAMIPYLKDYYGNPSGKYYLQSNIAREGVEYARKAIAKLVSCRTDEVIFTSGASEGNNFIIKGIADAVRNKGNHIITTNIEHSSVLEPMKYLEQRGYDVTYLSVDSTGQINLKELEESIREETILVSIGWANSELGSLQKILEQGQIIKKSNPSIFFHVDATQVVGKIKIKFNEIPVDSLTFSAHKLNGPKGVGATIIKRDEDGNKPLITPLIHGGDQEMGYRGSTLAVANIVGLGKAAEIASNNITISYKRLLDLREFLIDSLNKSGIEYKINSPEENFLPNIVNIRVGTINNETLIKDLANKVAISTGSACSSSKPSYVLKAIGLTDMEIRSSIRISFSRLTTEEEIITAVQSLKQVFLKFKAMFG